MVNDLKDCIGGCSYQSGNAEQPRAADRPQSGPPADAGVG